MAEHYEFTSPLTPEVPPEFGKLNQFLRTNGRVQIIRLHWVDYSGVLRTRFIPKQRALNLARGDDSYKLAQNCLIIPLSTAPDCFPAGPELWHVYPDWTSLRLCGFNSVHAAVMCSLDKQGAAKRFSHCPRALLREALDVTGKEEVGELLVGFEIEFVLLGPDNELHKPLDRVTGYSRTAGLRSKTLTMLEEIIESLALSRVPVHHFHTEVSDQLEIALSPLPPMAAVDALIFAQETIRTICIQHDLKASMSPRAVYYGPYNGCHMHLSLSRGDTRLSESFLAGIMAKMRPLCAFGMANFDSYVRVCPDAVGLFVGWGTENRDLPVRKVSERHWEFRFLDSTANPYLFLAALLFAGTEGIREQTPLELKDCNIFVPRAPDERAKYKIVDDMPKSLRETVIALKSDGDFADWFGREMLQQYVSIKGSEVDGFTDMTEEDRRKKFLDYF